MKKFVNFTHGYKKNEVLKSQFNNSSSIDYYYKSINKLNQKEKKFNDTLSLVKR